MNGRASPDRPDLAILFWFYKDAPLCESRLRLLQRLNPGTRIFGLFGGAPEAEQAFRDRLSPFLDDFHCFAGPTSTEWKWRNGDLLLTEWYRERGHGLPWDSIVVIQWDMLVLSPVHDLFASLPRGAVLLSGYRSIERHPVPGWVWVEGEKERQNYLRFLEHVRNRHSFDGDPTACIFLVVVLSRDFLEPYSEISEPELGFIEYRVPIYAQIFEIEVRGDDRFTIVAPGGRAGAATLTVGEPILLSTVIRNLLSPSGARVFHPYLIAFPTAYAVFAQAVRRALLEPLARWVRRIR